MDPMTANHTLSNPQAQIDMILQNSGQSQLARFIEFPNELYILSSPAHSESVSISVFWSNVEIQSLMVSDAFNSFTHWILTLPKGNAEKMRALFDG